MMHVCGAQELFFRHLSHGRHSQTMKLFGSNDVFFLLSERRETNQTVKRNSIIDTWHTCKAKKRCECLSAASFSILIDD